MRSIDDLLMLEILMMCRRVGFSKNLIYLGALHYDPHASVIPRILTALAELLLCSAMYHLQPPTSSSLHCEL